jgi:alpha-glucosidase (family GH31 glycosyl hydrolase)
MQDIWARAMDDFYNTVHFDGIWIDMNEPAQLLVLENTRGELLPDGYDYDVDKNQYEYIPYMPGFREKERTDLRTHSLSENAISVKYKEDPLYTSYNFKALMALMQAEFTKVGLEAKNKRSFVLTRSTTLGTGRYGFHWLGDNFSRFRDMRNGITGIFNFNLFGIPMTGDDICGFIDNTWDDLCARWMALGTLYPFSRNHRDIKSRNQEPYAFGETSNTLKISKIALPLRYSLLRYFYSNMYLISLGEKGSFFKPVFFNYVNDLKTYDYIDTTAMIGDNFILFPVFQNETTDIDAYFPNDDWNYLDGRSFITKKANSNEGETKKLSGAFDIIHLYLRGGSIIPYQDTSTYIKNTYELRQKRVQIIINPSSDTHTAKGTFIFDNDGIKDLENGDYNRYDLSFADMVLTVTASNTMTSTYQFDDDIVSNVKIYNAEYILTGGTYNCLKVTDNNDNVQLYAFTASDNIINCSITNDANLKLGAIKKIEFDNQVVGG